MAVAYLKVLSGYMFLIFHFYPVSFYFLSTLSLKQSTTNNCFYFTATRSIAYSQKKASMPTIESVFANIPVVNIPRKQSCTRH
jgi:hypothetical protein